MATSTNDDTHAVLKRAFDDHQPRISIVPTFEKRATFRVNDNDKDGLALLGSPEIAWVAWALVQHKHDLGDKVAESIEVWDEVSPDVRRKNLEDAVINIMVTIGDSQSDTHEDSDDSPGPACKKQKP